MFIFEIFMIFLGMILSTIFQDPLNKLYLNFRRTIFRLFNRMKKEMLHQTKTFVIGKRVTNVVIIDGDGYNTFQNKNLQVHISNELPYDLPQDILEYRRKIVAELEERKNRGEVVPWNGNVLSLYKYVISRTEDFEDYKLDVFLAKNDYYTVYSTIHNLNDGEPSLRDKYIENFTFESNVIYPLPNAIGLCLCVRTKDNKLIFAVRASESGYRPGQSDVSVVEGLNPQYDMHLHSINLSNACYRAIYEEIGNIEKDKVDVSVLGLVFDKEYNQWNFIGDAFVNMTQDELIARRNSGTSGKWELKNLDFIKFHPKDIFQYLSTHKMWDMGIVTVYFTLVYNGFSKEKLEHYIKKYLNR
jgi:hypothetical protein